MKRVLTTMTCSLLVLGVSTIALSAEWEMVTGEQALRSFMSGTTLEWEEPGGGKSRGEYYADGTGTLHAWGASIPRTWEVKGDQICFTAGKVTECWQLEKNTADSTLYRSHNVATGEITEIRMSRDGEKATLQGAAKSAGNEGGTAAPSADEMAALLANPSSPVANLTFKNQIISYDGDLPDAGNQTNYQLFFQPILPFPLANGDQIVWRSGIKYISDKPIIANGGFEGESGLSDWDNEIVYVKNTKGGFIGAGSFLSFPTGTDSRLTSGRWLLGPEFVVGKVIPSKFVFTGVLSHAWDVAGWTDTNVSNTTISPIAVFLLGNGWDFGTFGVMNYDWESEQWTVPLNLGVGRTLILSGRPWKFQVEVDYYVEKPDAFGPDWMISLNIIPVVENKLANLFK